MTRRMTTLLPCFRVEMVPGAHTIFISSVIGARRQLRRNGPKIGRFNVPNFEEICCCNVGVQSRILCGKMYLLVCFSQQEELVAK